MSPFPCLAVTVKNLTVRCISVTHTDLRGGNLCCSWHHPTDILNDLTLTTPRQDPGAITWYRGFTTHCWAQLYVNTNLREKDLSPQKLTKSNHIISWRSLVDLLMAWSDGVPIGRTLPRLQLPAGTHLFYEKSFFSLVCQIYCPSPTRRLNVSLIYISDQSYRCWCRYLSRKLYIFWMNTWISCPTLLTSSPVLPVNHTNVSDGAYSDLRRRPCWTCSPWLHLYQ